MRFAFTKCHGSGNDFPLIDARALTLDDEHWAQVARALADRGGPVGGDGLLLLVAGDGDHAFGMRMFNSDGSEAETCLNGLRCVARAGFEALDLDAARVRLKTSAADVAREAELAPGVTTVRTTVGPASTELADVGLTGPLSELPTTRIFTAVAMPNPHLVTFVDAINEAELVALGEYCEAGPPLIPARANVSFVELRGPDLFVRTFERGVGLTDSCGSAMAASVLAAGLTGRVPLGLEVRVFNKGGLVRGRADADHIVTISGNATFLYDAVIDIDLPTGRVDNLIIHARREDEAEAWSAAVAALG
ncbi:diaminopimelate epimerase [Sphingomonas psychrotolerans]|uniref:Diaminopimelate epimerase n=1 Tax=Sphingomonas psychrotolerans TaxID=1327635 RepID=A0ABU3N3Z8_9SPHN|nr:diaminopimelate epimerase [Sphingomonas psychrotolerans]MDT8758996.1 diaminopimelate epimerase [Sphingomonas psychrotolerans]